MPNAAPPSPRLDKAYHGYVVLLLRHFHLLSAGREDSEEAEGVVAALAQCWERLDDAQRRSVNGINSDLNWVRRRGSPPPRGRTTDQVTTADSWALLDAENAGDWHAALHALRLCAPTLQASDLSRRRARAYAGLGLFGLAHVFTGFAAECGLTQEQAADLSEMLGTFRITVTPDATEDAAVPPSVSWAGFPAVGDLLSVGLTDGRVQQIDRSGLPLGSAVRHGPSTSSVTGVCRSGSWVMVATAGEMTLVDQAGAAPGLVRHASFPYQGEGLACTPSGRFVTAAGRRGLVVVRPDAGDHQPVTVVEVPGSPSFARVACLADGERELLVCALRGDGVAILESGEDPSGPVTLFTRAGSDVVDLCPLDRAGAPFGVIGLTSDGLLMLFRDIREQASPLTLGFRSMRGAARRVLSIRGDVYVLTDQGVVVLAGVADRFATGALLTARKVSFANLTAEGTEITTDGRFLVVTMPGAVELHDTLLVRSAAPPESVSAETTATKVAGEWKLRSVQQKSRKAPMPAGHTLFG